MKSRAELEESLRLFESNLPALAEITDPLADATIDKTIASLLAEAAPGAAEFVREPINCLLGSAGLIPSDDAGEPCGALAEPRRNSLNALPVGHFAKNLPWADTVDL